MSQRLRRRDFLRHGSAALAAAALGAGGARAGPQPAASAPASAPAAGAPGTGLVTDPIYERHLPDTKHVESPRRCRAIIEALEAANFAPRLLYLAPRPAEEADILACHSAAYLRTVKRDVAGGAASLSTGDTLLSPDSLTAALAAAGGACAAIEAVLRGRVATAFCVLRPPGHHATRERGMGFCIFNNVAVAARYAQRRHGIGKVLIVDWDVHHGNGTQDIFYEDGSVLFFDTHESPLYPGTGKESETGTGKGQGCIINCPFPAGSGRKEILGAYEAKLLPAAARFKPELVLISAGFDSRAGDPLGHFTLTDADFAEMTRKVLAIAREHAGGRVVSVLEGGYNLDGLASAAAAHVRALGGAA